MGKHVSISYNKRGFLNLLLFNFSVNMNINKSLGVLNYIKQSFPVYFFWYNKTVIAVICGEAKAMRETPTRRLLL